MTQSNSSRDLEQRIISLEETMMHQERLLASLNDAICSVRDRLDAQSRQFTSLKKSLDDIKSHETEERSFEDERPPHY